MEGLDYLGALTDDERAHLESKVVTKVSGGAAIGALVGAVALAALWKSHRVWGGLLGLFVVGPAAGWSAGRLAASGDIARLNEDYAKRKTLPVTGESLKKGDKVRGVGLLRGAPQAGVVETAEADYTGSGSGQVYVKWNDGSSSSAKIADLVRA
jgi:hypothetical protein